MELSEIKELIDGIDENINVEQFLLQYPVDQMVEFNEDNVKQKLSDNCMNIFKFKKLKILSEFKCKKIKSILEKCKSEQFEFYKYHFEKPLRTEEIIEFYFPRDEKIIKIEENLELENLKINFFQSCIEIFLEQSKRMIDLIKILEIEK
jgi:hypothetical protein